MKKGMLLFCSAWLTSMIVSIYSMNIRAADNSMIYFSHFVNKKILIVNIASAATNVDQLADLEQFYLQNKDSIVVVAFPSNSFGAEPRNDQEIVGFLKEQYNITFPVACKSEVKGNSANAVYKWLRSKTQNGSIDTAITGNFQKILLNKKGTFVAIFDSSKSPLDTALINAFHRY